MEPPKADMALSLIQSIQKSGRAIQILNALCDEEVFRDLSKHNPYWTHEDEAVYDKLDNAHTSFRFIKEKIYEVLEILEVDPYERSL